MLGAVLLVLVWIVREANPEWRLVGIVLSLLATGTAAVYVHNTGGARWMRHFSSPLLFFFAAVPWPAFVERGITETLMPLNAALALEVLQWAGVPAVVRGNLISLPNGTIGIEEACSGIRSLQTTIMIAWFVSDLLHLRWRGRLIVFGAGMASALLSNAGRTVFLSMTAARSGVNEVASWHDTAALAALGANALAVLLAGWLVSRKQVPHRPIARQRNTAEGLRLPRRGPLICAAGLAAMFPLTALWYRAGEQEPLPLWRLEKPVNSRAFREVPLDDRTRLMLRFSRGWSAAWETAENRPLHGFFLEWDNGTAPPEVMNVHLPGGCLANVGIQLEEELAPLEIIFEGRTWTFRVLRFRDGTRPLFLLYGVHSNVRHRAQDVGPFDFSYSNRWESVIRGYRNPGQRLVEVGLWDAPSEEHARATFRELLETHLRPPS